jgi:hypothetical protein
MASAPAKLLSRDVHTMLRDAWAASLKAAGWKRSRLSPTAWSFSQGEDTVSFWVQIDKYGWWDGFGSELTVEFQYESGAPSQQPGGLQDRARYAGFLSDDDVMAVVAANIAVRNSLPHDPPRAFPDFDPYPNDFEARTLTPDLARRFDLWMRYYRPEHVQWIADFMLSRIGGIAVQLRADCRARDTLPS